MDNTSRIIIATLLLLALFFYPQLISWLYPPRPGAPGPKTAGTPGPTPQASGAPAQPAPAEAGMPSPLETAPTVEVDTDLYQAVFTTLGARLKSLRLKHYRESVSAKSAWYEMVPPATRLPLGVVVGWHDGSTADDAGISYQTDAPARVEVRQGHGATIVFKAKTPKGLEIRKTFTFSSASYVFDAAVELGGATQGVRRLGFTMSQGLGAREGYRDIPELQADVQSKVITESEKSLRGGVAPVSGEIAYAGFGDRYFLSVFMPKDPTSGALEMGFVGDEADARLIFPDVLRARSAVYMGPKRLELLEAAGSSLTKAIDFGWTGILAIIFLRALKLFHYVAPNYGVDIILVTVVLRILSLPLTIKSQRSMLRLQRLQPQVERLREKFKDDSERLNREMVDLYKRNHVNPLGGCLPMLIQLPVFVGLYQALLNAIELRHAPFLGWIRDLSAPDCLPISAIPQLPLMSCRGIPVLVLLMGLSTFLQQWMSPRSPDPNQQRMMMLTPIMFTVLFVNLPAGLSLYYFASNLLGMVQQFVLNRETKQFSPVTA